MSNASLIYSTCKQLKGTVLAEGIWFANQICPYMFECFHDPLTKPGKGTAGWVCLIITTAALTGTLPQDLKAAQSVDYWRFYSAQQVVLQTTVYLLEPRCNRWQMIRLCYNLFVLILIRDKHLPTSISHRRSALIWFWGHIKPFYCTPGTSAAHTTFALAFSLWFMAVCDLMSQSWHEWGVGAGQLLCHSVAF